MKQRIASGLVIFLIIVLGWATSARQGKAASPGTRRAELKSPIASALPVSVKPDIAPGSKVSEIKTTEAVKPTVTGSTAVESTVKGSTAAKPKVTGSTAAKQRLKPVIKPVRKQPSSRESSNLTGIDKVLKIAFSFKGVPYRYGGQSPKGFDCSGFTSYVFKAGAGISLPRSSQGQAKIGTAVSKDNLAPGDLVYFHTYRKGVSHVGVYVGNGNFIHASRSKGITVTNLSDSFYGPRYLGARRILM